MKKGILYSILLTTAGFLLQTCNLERIEPGDTSCSGKPTFNTWFGKDGMLEDGASDVFVLSSGGYITVGYQEQSINTDAEGLIVRFDNDGQVVWSKTQKAGISTYLAAVEPIPSGGFVTVGTNYATSQLNEIFICRFDENGNISYSKSLPGLSTNYIAQDVLVVSNGFLIAGSSWDNVDGQMLLLKTDFNGNLISTKSIGMGSYESGSHLVATQDGGYVIVGNSDGFGTSGDYYMLKLDASLTIMWEQHFSAGANYRCLPNAILETTDGGFLLAGEAYDQSNNSVTDIFLLRTNSNGVEVWRRLINNTSYEFCTGAALANQGFIAVTGWKTVNNELRPYLLKIPDSGGTSIIWERFYDQYSTRSIKLCCDGGFALCGSHFNPADQEEDVYLIRTNSEGNY